MSAFIAVVGNDQAHVLCDGAHYDSEGVVRLISSKAVLLQSCGALVIGRGVTLITRRFADMAYDACRSYDELLDQFPMLIGRVHASIAKEAPWQADNYDLLLAGYSEDRRKVEAYFAAGRSKELEPGVLYEVRGCCGAGPVNALRSFVEADHAPAEFDAVHHGIPVLEAMRLEVESPSEAIGGFIEHAAITAEGIERRIIHWWPDEVGRRVGMAKNMAEGDFAGA